MATRHAFDTLRQPEYTGENRCTPCTIVNLTIAAVASAALALAWPALAVPAFATFVGVIYLRGYLVPGTPTLTKRYLPDRVLAWFDKAPPSAFEAVAPTDSLDDLDPEAVLVGVGALEAGDDGADLRLADAFEEAWRAHLDRLRGDDGAVRAAFADLLGVTVGRVSVDGTPRSVRAKLDGDTVGRWGSRAAFVADVAADRAFTERTRDWSDLPVDQRSRLLASLRVFLERCPECDGRVAMREEVVKSCCRSREVIAAECRDCGARLFEVDAAEVDSTAEAGPRAHASTARS